MAKTAQEKLDAKREKAYYKKHKKMYRTKPGDVVFNIFNYIFFSAFTLTCIFPFYYLFINTVSDNELVKRGLINFYPKGFNIDNYIALREVGDLGTSFIVTIDRYSTHGSCFRFRRLHRNKAGNVAQKFLVSFPRYYNVLQCRFDPMVLEHGIVRFDKELFSLHHSYDRSSV